MAPPVLLSLVVVAPAVIYGAITVCVVPLDALDRPASLVGPFPGWEEVELQVLPGDVVVLEGGNGPGGAFLVLPSVRGDLGGGVVLLPADERFGLFGCGLRSAVLSARPAAGLPFRRTTGYVVAATRPPGLWGDVLCQLQVGFGR